MKILIRLDTDARTNLTENYTRLKNLKNKKKTIIKAIEDTENIIKEYKEKNKNIPIKKSKKKKKHWWDIYHSFVTTNDFRVIAGKNAKQNDEIYAKHLTDKDLFFHADIQGAPAVVLKNGINAKKQDLTETAQWAASFSSAWKISAAEVDVYAVEKEQISKHSQGGYIGRGAFAITGQRKWFRKTQLRLKIGKKDDEVEVLPAIHTKKMAKETALIPGKMEKDATAKELSAHLGAKKDLIIGLLPSGKFSISK